jgi:hypothetical protein
MKFILSEAVGGLGAKDLRSFSCGQHSIRAVAAPSEILRRFAAQDKI